jgi:Tle cognate immunity protein 4 C-terminal domain
MKRCLLYLLAALVATIGLPVLGNASRGDTLDKTASTPATRAHCVGRFLIELPTALEQTAGSDVELIYGLDKNFRKIQVRAPSVIGERPAFDKAVLMRVSELTKKTHFESVSKNMLASRTEMRPGAVLVRAYKSPDLLDSFQSELFAQIGQATGTFVTRVFGGDKPEELESNLLKAVDRTTYLSDPNQQGRGACLGPLLIDAKQDGEVFTVSFRSKVLKDVLVNINMNSLVEESDGGLLKRWDSKAGMLRALDFSSSTLRRGKIVIAGRPGEELLTKGKEQDRVVRQFTAEVLRTTPATFAAPALSISMSMGGQINSSEYVDATWSEKEAIAIWDSIVKSIRLRPGAL